MNSFDNKQTIVSQEAFPNMPIWISNVAQRELFQQEINGNKTIGYKHTKIPPKKYSKT
jgi:hypothetical protein